MSGLEFPFIPQCKENLSEDSNRKIVQRQVFSNYTLQVFLVFSEVFGTDYPSETDTESWLHVVSFSHGSSTGLFAVAKMGDLVM